MAMEVIPYSSPIPAFGSTYAPSSYYGGSAYSASKYPSEPRSSYSRAGSDYSSASTAKTFGDPTRAYYAPGQAPPAYFTNSRERALWDSAPRSSDGKKYRTVTRLQYPVRDCEVPVPSSSSSRKSSISSRRSSASSKRSSRRGGSPLDDERTLGPGDSISQFSVKEEQGDRRPFRAFERSGSLSSSPLGEQMYYAREQTLLSVSSRRSGADARIQFANERLVREVRPEWAV